VIDIVNLGIDLLPVLVFRKSYKAYSMLYVAATVFFTRLLNNVEIKILHRNL